MEGSPRIVVVAETPSLARSIGDLLETEGMDVITVRDSGRELVGQLEPDEAPVSLVISASNGFYCETARRWMRGEISGVDLVVVGSRDPDLRSGPRVHVVGLPLVPGAFLRLVRHLLDGTSVSPPKVDDGSDRRPGKPPRRQFPGARRRLSLPRVRLGDAT